MAITNYTELQTAVGNWLNRADLTSRIPEFIALAEADIRRELRDQKFVGSLPMVVGQDYITLPSTVKELKNLRYDESTMQWSLREKTPAGLAAIRQPTAGIPQAYMVINNVVYFDRPADSAYIVETTYVAELTALSVSNTTNNTLTKSPDIYLYGTLRQAAPYLDHDERVQMWADYFEAAIVKENIYRERQEYGASPEMDLPTVFGEEC